MKKFLFAAIALLAVSGVLAYPQYVGKINDFGGIFSADEEVKMQAAINSIEQNSTVEVAVITLKTLDGEPIAEYATNIGNEWGVGKKGKDNGLVLVIAIEERDYFFAVGSGLEGTLPDSLIGRIGRDYLVPNFRHEQYGLGVIEALEQVRGIVAQDPSIVANYEDTWQDRFLDSYGLAYLIAVFVLVIAVNIVTIKLREGKKWGTRAGIFGGLILTGYILNFVIFIATVFIVFWVSMMLAGLRSKGGGIIWGGGLGGGGFGGGGFSGGFGGGGFSGGGAGGGW